MPEPLSDDLYADLITAINDQNASSLRKILLGGEFILISVRDPDDPEDEEGIGALTADLDGEEVLVVFSSEQHAGAFVGEMTDMFDESEEVQGFMVEGDALLEYLPEDFGMLLNPESEQVQFITRGLAGEVLSLGG